MGIKKTSLALAISTILASSVSADITGVVYKDFDFNGQQNGNDALVSGVAITASCEGIADIATTTDANGAYAITGIPQGSNCRIEADPSNAGVGSGANALGSAPLVDFVADGSVHNISTASPATYCQANPDVVMGASPGWHDDNGRKSPDGFGTIFKVPTPDIGSFNANATIPAKRITLSNFEDTGAIWGLAWKKGTEELFAAATLKRYVPLKGDLGAIYKIDNANNVSLFTTVPNVTTAAADTAIAARTYGQNEDTEILDFVGRQGLGDIDINEEETKLYTVNMATRELIVIDANNGTILETLALPNPYAGQCDADKVRPWAVKVRGSDVFIGSVCEDQIENDLGSAIQKYNGGIITTVAETNSLQYLKARSYNPRLASNGAENYKNWSAWHKNGPMLTDIEFTNDGDLVLGYTSRASFNKNGSLRGDIRKMCLNSDGSFTDESTGIAPTDCATHEVTYGAGNPETYHEFYLGDYFGANFGAAGHPETASGALAQAPGAPNIIVGMVDATDWNQPGAIGLYSNTTGDKIGAQAVINNSSSAGGEKKVYAGKAGGMGDVELLCDPAPIEIGNLVWEDSNTDGIQSAGEPALANVPVTLFCDGQLFGTTTTDSKGHFYFGGESNANIGSNTIVTGQACELSLDKSDVNNKPATTKDANNNADDIRDNDAVDDGSGKNVITFDTSVANNHSLDFGIEAAVGCAKGILFQDNNNDGVSDLGDTIAPAGITVKITDKFGTEHTAVTDNIGAFTLDGIPAGNATISVDTTDTDIPQGAVWPSFSESITIAEGTVPNSCSVQDFPFGLPAEIDQDPKDVATCANPSSITWDGSAVSSKSVWQNMLNDTATVPKTFATVGALGSDTVGVKMYITNDDDEFYDTDAANSSGSGTSAAFGQPYLTMYLGDQAAPGNGTYNDGSSCAANGYDLEAGEKADLVVEFDEPVILDNWRIRDVDSGDLRGAPAVANWEWQDGIIVTAEDVDGNTVEIETKIGSSGVGLIKDADGTIHSDPSSYVATNGAGWDDGDGVVPNSANGHIVLTSNFAPIKKLTITHVAGPDMACQTRSALALAGLAVCKPLHISGTVFDDGNGNDPRDGVCENKPDGEQLYVQLIGSNGLIVDTHELACLDSDNQATDAVVDFDFDTNIKPNTDYSLVLTTENKSAGETASQPSLPTLWNNVGEVDPTDTATPALEGTVSTADGKISVSVAADSIENIDFGINKKPTATSYTDPVVFNPNGDTKVPLVEACSATNPIADLEDTTPPQIKVTSLPDASAGVLYYNDVAVTEGQLIDTPDMCLFSVDPADGDVQVNFTYVSVDAAGVESDPEVIIAPFKSPQISGTLFLDGNGNGNVDGTEIGTSCDTTTQLYANLVGANGNVIATRAYDNTDGSYLFTYADGVRANTDFTVVLSQVEGTIGNPAPTSELPAGCSIGGENVGPTGTDGTADGVVAVSVVNDNVVEANFSISQMVKIGNRVWIEDDNDGDATNGTTIPVIGATVTAVCNDISYSAVTDSTGNYEINVPLDSTCTVTTATPNGTLPTKGSDDATATSDANEDNKTHDSTGTTVSVTTADDLTVDFGFTSSVKIGNQVWIEDDNDGDSTTGTITPVVGSTVTAVCDDKSYSAVTDSTGNYEIEVPSNSMCTVSLPTPANTIPTDGSEDAATAGEDNKSHNNAGTTVDVATTDDMTLDFGFTSSVKIGNRVWIEDDNDGDATTGTIAPVVGSTVTAVCNDISYSAETDNAGNYAITVPLNSTCTVSVPTPANTLPALGSDDATAGEENKTHNGAGTTVTVAATDDMTLDFGFTPSVKIGNRVWIEDDNDGDATTGNITPVEGSTVTAVCNEVSYSAVTDSNGNYDITVPANSTCAVSVSTPADTLPTLGSGDATSGEENKSHDNKETIVSVTTEDDMTLDFGFTPSVKIGNRIWIEDDNDGDISTGNITIPPAGTVVTATDSDGRTYTAVTDENGFYYINVPQNDTYIVGTDFDNVATKGSDDSEVPDTSSENDKPHNPSGTTVVVGTEDNLTLDFGFTPDEVGAKPGFVKIGDRVWIEDDNDGDASTGNITIPKAGLVVTAVGTDGTKYTGTTDASGNYEIEVPENDTYTVTTQAPPGTCAALHCAKEGDLEIELNSTSENDLTHDGTRGTKVTVGTEDNMTVDFGFCPVTVVTGTKGGSFSYLLLSLLGAFGLRRRLAKLNSK